MNEPTPAVALVTGAAHRIGAAIARALHGNGMDIVLHYRSSVQAAEELKSELEAQRQDSVLTIQADLMNTGQLPGIIRQVEEWRGRLDLLVNNASAFFSTPVDQIIPDDWDNLMGSNLKAPFFLSLAAAPLLKRDSGSIINLVDIHAERPLKDYPVYSMAKAGNAMMVKSLARELGPEVRVNGVAPGAILWPEQGLEEAARDEILNRTSLKRPGRPEDIANTVLFLATGTDYITGQIIAVDGGRTIQQ